MSIPIVGVLGAAVDAGCVADATAQALSKAQVFDLGVNPDEIRTEKVTLVIVWLDDSGSMSSQRSTVVRVLNENLLVPLKAQQTRNDILVAVVSMWHGVLMPFTRIEQVEIFEARDFRPDGNSTPMYQGIRDTLRLAVDKQGELALASIQSRIMFLAYTDGAENVYSVTASELRPLVLDIDGRKNNALYGIACGSRAHASLTEAGFKRVSNADDPVALADAFNQFSRATSAAASAS